jgi:putative heme-binding domain-containing protein
MCMGSAMRYRESHPQYSGVFGDRANSSATRKNFQPKDAEAQVDWVDGTSIMISRKTLQTGGLLPLSSELLVGPLTSITATRPETLRQPQHSGQGNGDGKIDFDALFNLPGPEDEVRSFFGTSAFGSAAAQSPTIVGAHRMKRDSPRMGMKRATVLDNSAADTDRREALQSLLRVNAGASVKMLHGLAAERSTLRRDAIQALAIRNDKSTPDVLLSNYDKFDGVEKQDAIGVLTTRLSFVESLLTAMEAGQVNRKDVSAFALQQLRTFDDQQLQSRVLKLWADDTVKVQKSEELARLLKLMTPEYLSDGDARAGRLVFQKTCVKCHRLFGEGGTIAPDLTGSGRKKSDYVLSNLVDPSAQIDPAYRLTTLFTEDGRLMSGFIVRQTDSDVVFRTQNARVRLSMKDVEAIRTSNISMMPEGMLRTFTDEQLRDLLVYLAGSSQVPIPQSIGGD